MTWTAGPMTQEPDAEVTCVTFEVWALKPRSVRVCTLFYKPAAFKEDFKVDYVGREIGNEFIVGYGLDYDEHGRGLKDVWVVRG